jgi:predicted permease
LVHEVISSRFSAIRLLKEKPGLSFVCVISLAFGIGVNTAIFTTAKVALIDRLHVPDSEQLKLLTWTQPKDGPIRQVLGSWDNLSTGGMRSAFFSYPAYKELRRENESLMDIVAFRFIDSVAVTIAGATDTMSAEAVSGNYYSCLGIQPQVGRAINDADAGEEGSARVVLISDRLWRTRFGGARDIIGKIIFLNARPMTIVGVNPPGFTGAYSAQNLPALVFPLSEQPIVWPQSFGSAKGASLLATSDVWWLNLMGRARNGVSSSDAEAFLNIAFHNVLQNTMATGERHDLPKLAVQSGSRGVNPFRSLIEKPLLMLMSLAGLVLFLACTNIASLLLARWRGRQKEVGVRLALGASRGRIIWQILAESLLLSALGGSLGIVLAWSVRSITPRLFTQVLAPVTEATPFSISVIGYTLFVSLAAGTLSGLIPAWRSGLVNIPAALKVSGFRATVRRRDTGVAIIVILQISISTILAVGAVLFVQTLVKLGSVPIGLRSEGVSLFDVDLPEARYSNAASIDVIRRISARVASVPGVQSVTVMRVPLMSGFLSATEFDPDGQQVSTGARPRVLMNNIGLKFFATFGIPILLGRDFRPVDESGSRKVAIINRSLADRFFPGINPIGKTFSSAARGGEAVEIVGVCANAKYYSVREPMEPTYYVPYWQREGGVHSVTFAVRSQVSGDGLLHSLRAALRDVDGYLALNDLRNFDAQIRDSIKQERTFAVLTSIFGVLALGLACIGVYGLMTNAVSERTTEIGVRMALGATRAGICKLMLSDAALLSITAIAAGDIAGVVLVRVIKSLLYGIETLAPYIFLEIAALLFLVSVAASWVPAARAANLQPTEALKRD